MTPDFLPDDIFAAILGLCIALPPAIMAWLELRQMNRERKKEWLE
jgi:hypothetical protein